MYMNMVVLDHSWSTSFPNRVVYVKRKGAEVARKVPPDFDAFKAAFLEHVREAATVERFCATTANC